MKICNGIYCYNDGLEVAASMLELEVFRLWKQVELLRDARGEESVERELNRIRITVLQQQAALIREQKKTKL